MPLPAGFKVNGSKKSESTSPVPPRVQKLIKYLDKIPLNDLFTTMDLALRTGSGISGSFTNHPALAPYREIVDAKLFWGSPKSIAKLRAQLAEPEETSDEN